MIVSSLAALFAGGILCANEVLGHKREKEIKLLLEELHLFKERAEEDARRIVEDAMDQAENIMLTARQQEAELQESMKAIKSSILALEITESTHRARVDASKEEVARAGKTLEDIRRKTREALSQETNAGAALTKYKETYHLHVVISKDIQRVKTRIGHIMSMPQNEKTMQQYEELLDKASKLFAAEDYNNRHIDENRARAVSMGIPEERLLEIEHEVVKELAKTRQ